MKRILAPLLAVAVVVCGISLAAAQTEPTAPLGTWCPPIPTNAVAGQDIVCKVVADPNWTPPTTTTTTSTTTTTPSTTTVPSTTTTTVPPVTTTTTTPPVDGPPATADNTGPRVAAFQSATASVFGNGGTAANPLVISGRSFSGFINLNASHVVIRDSRFNGGLGLVSTTNVTVEYTEIVGDIFLASAVDTVVRATEIRNSSSDLIHITSDRGRYVRNALIDTVWAHSPMPSNDAHTDGVQLRGVQGVTIRNSFLDLGTFKSQHNAAFFSQQGYGNEPYDKNADVRVTDTWMRGGGYTFRYEDQNRPGVFEVSGLRVMYRIGGPNWWGPQYNPKFSSGTSSPTLESNNKVQRADGTWANLDLL